MRIYLPFSILRNFLVLLLITQTQITKAQTFKWAIRDTGNMGSAYSVTADKKGNVYATGFFVGTEDFDPGPGVFNLTAANEDVFLQKLDANGNLKWAFQFGGGNYNTGHVVVADSFGNIYVAGDFQGTVDFNPGAGTNTMTAYGGYDVFIVKLDTAGNFKWAKQQGGFTDDHATAFTTDRSGNVYVGATFDSKNMRVLKYDSSGNLVFSKSTATPPSSGVNGGVAWGMALDKNKNIFTCGNFTGTLDFDGGSGVFNMTSVPLSNPNAYVSKLDSNGNFLWARQINGTVAQSIAMGIAADSAGNSYFTGYFSYTVDLDPGTGVYNVTSVASPGMNTFIVKLDPAGNFAWGQHLKSTRNIQATGICTDAAGSIYATGYMADTVDFDPGPGTFYLGAVAYSTPPAVTHGYVLKLSSNDSFQNAFEITSTAGATPRAIMVDPAANIYVSGAITGSCDFDPGAGTFLLTAPASSNIPFAAKYSQKSVGGPNNSIVTLNGGATFSIAPNPCDGNFKVSFGADQSEDVAFIVTDMTGRQVHKFTATKEGVYTLPNQLPAGTYILCAITNDNKMMQKLVVIK